MADAVYRSRSALFASARSLGFLAVVGAGFVLLSLLLKFAGISLHTEGDEEGPRTIFNTLALCAIGVGTTAVLARFEHRSPLSYGLADRRALARLAMGLCVGVAVFGILLVVLMLCGAIRFEAGHRNALDVLSWGLFWLACYSGVALSEEVLFRGYLLSTLTVGLGPFVATIVTSLLFGLAHLSNGLESPMAVINAVLFGAVLAWSVLRSGSLWWAIGLHAGWDWTESYVAGASDSGIRATGRLMTALPHGSVLWSGGAAGPEGSLMMLLPMSLTAIICAAMFGGSRSRRAYHIQANDKPQPA